MIRHGCALASLLLLVGCSAKPADVAPDKSHPVTINVYAAASLKQTFTELGEMFEREHAGVKVAFNFGGSSDLVAQIQQGAPADVFASADEANMAKLGDLIAGKPRPFASNTLEIAVPPTNPAKVTGLRDLTSPGVDVVVCAPQVPCGAAAATVAKASHLRFHTVSEEQNVTDVLSKVESGQADAGLVYVTDVKAASNAVQGIRFAEADKAVNVYPIATLADTKHTAEARDFADLVFSQGARKVFLVAGFAKP